MLNILVLGLCKDEFYGVIACFIKESSSLDSAIGGGFNFLIPGFFGELGTTKSLYDFYTCLLSASLDVRLLC